MNNKLDAHTQHLLGHGVCPACGSPEIEGDSVDFEGPSIFQECWCLDCNQAWVDEYKLISYKWRV